MNRSVFEYFRRPDCNCCATSECYSWTDCGFTWTRDTIKNCINEAKPVLKRSDVLFAIITFECKKLLITKAAGNNKIWFRSRWMIVWLIIIDEFKIIYKMHFLVIRVIFAMISLYIASFLEAFSRILAVSCPYRGDHHPESVWILYAGTILMSVATLIVKCVEYEGWNMARRILNVFNIFGVILYLIFLVAFDQRFCIDNEYASFYEYKNGTTLVSGTHVIARDEILRNQPKTAALRKMTRCGELKNSCYIRTFTQNLSVLLGAMFFSWFYCMLLFVIKLKKLFDPTDPESTDPDTETTDS